MEENKVNVEETEQKEETMEQETVENTVSGEVEQDAAVEETEEKEEYTDYEKRVRNWQDTMNLDYNSNLAIDGSFGPACREQALEHYLYYKIPTIKKINTIFN